MRSRREDSRRENGDGHRGFSALLRSLLDGIPWSERAEAEEVVQLGAPAGGIFRVHNSNGRTHVFGEDREDIEITLGKVSRAESSDAAAALLDEIRLARDETGDALEVEVIAPRKWNRRGHANLEIHLPRGMQVDVSGVNGRVEIEGVRGAVRARSSNGSATISDVVGDIQVATSNAKVSCSCTCGRLMARSSNGKIELQEHRGSVDASTSNGPIRCSLDQVGKHGVHLATSNGRIVLDLPDDVDADVDIRVDNGVIRNDRELCEVTRQSDGRMRGRIGAGGAMIKLRTSNGWVSLR